MKIVFVAGPFRGNGSVEGKRERVETARKYIHKLIDAEISFYSPHLNLDQELMELEESKETFAINTNHEMLDRSDILAVLPGWQESSGTKNEIKIAKSKNMHIVYLEEKESISRLELLVNKST